MTDENVTERIFKYNTEDNMQKPGKFFMTVFIPPRAPMPSVPSFPVADNCSDELRDKIKGLKRKSGGRNRRIWSWLRKIFTITAWSILGVLVFISGVLLAGYYAVGLPDTSQKAQVERTNVYFSDGITPIGIFAEINRREVELQTLPDYVAKTLVAAEQPDFLERSDPDFFHAVSTFWRNIFDGNGEHSSISKRYVQAYYANTDKSLLAPIKDAMRATKVEETQSTQEILSNYLNTISFKNGAYGIEAGAGYYFGKPAKELSLEESAYLMAVANLRVSQNGKPPEKAKIEQKWVEILDVMAKKGWVSAEQVAQLHMPDPIANNYLAHLGNTQKQFTVRDIILEKVKAELLASKAFSLEELETGGYKVVTTIDPQLQKQLEVIVAQETAGMPNEVNLNVISVAGNTGEVKALYASRINQGAQKTAISGQLDEKKSNNSSADNNNSGGTGGSADDFKANDNNLTENQNSLDQKVPLGTGLEPFGVLARLQEHMPLTSSITAKSALDDHGNTNPDGAEAQTPADGSNQSTQTGLPKQGLERPSVLEALASQDKSLTSQLLTENEIPRAIALVNSLAFGTPITVENPTVDGDTKLPPPIWSTWEISQAYATLSAQGVRQQLHFVKEVLEGDARRIYTGDKPGKRILARDVSNALSFALKYVPQPSTPPIGPNSNGDVTSRFGNLSGTEIPVYGGADGYGISNWYVGYGSNLSTVVSVYGSDANLELQEMPAWVQQYKEKKGKTLAEEIFWSLTSLGLQSETFAPVPAWALPGWIGGKPPAPTVSPTPDPQPSVDTKPQPAAPIEPGDISDSGSSGKDNSSGNLPPLPVVPEP